MQGSYLAIGSQDEVFEGLAFLVIDLAQEDGKLLGILGLKRKFKEGFVLSCERGSIFRLQILMHDCIHCLFAAGRYLLQMIPAHGLLLEDESNHIQPDLILLGCPIDYHLEQQLSSILSLISCD